MTDGLMPIGRLARLSRLSIGALRRYDAAGLLAPAWVDPDSGYRYYAPAQVRTATAIAVLRSLDVPLAAIREILAAHEPGAVRPALARERVRIEREIAGRRQALRSLARLLDAESVLPYEVTLAPEPALRLGGLSATVTAERLGSDVGALARRAVALATERGWTLRGGLVGLYPLDLPDTFEVALGVPVGHADPAVAELPAGTAASTVHVGAYDELALAYTSLFAWCHEHGHEPCGPVVETYVSDPDQVAPEHLVTRLAIRVIEVGRQA